MGVLMVLRVVAYCRVSTDSLDQQGSLESQKRYFTEYISRNPDWELAEVYVDEGITGTSTRKRRAFNQMMADAENRAFDLILTKEISRFARNTLDSIFYTRKLKDLGIGVVFVGHNINTLEPDAELRLTIMSSIAQEESRKTSDRVKWGQKRRMEQGVVFGRDLLGYDVRGGKLHINGEGAETVRLIFHKFVREGKGTHVIARELREAGIPTATYMKTWSNTVILRVLRNEKYCGDLVQKKTFTPSYLTHEKRRNRGEEELVTLRDHHEPIVSRELFELARQELARRSPTPSQKAKHSNRYCFSGKIKCGVCGRSFVSRTKKRNSGSVYKAWRCGESACHGSPHVDKAGNAVGCSCPSVNDEVAGDVLRQIVRDLHGDMQKAADSLMDTITKVLGTWAVEDRGADLENELEKTQAKKERLLELYLNGDIAGADFRKARARLEEEHRAIQGARQRAIGGEKPRTGQPEAVAHIAEAVFAIASGEEWDDTFYRHLLAGVVVGGDGGLEIALNHHPLRWRAKRP